MTYTVGVRALCEFTARRGDLDLRFGAAPTAQEGMAGHASVAAGRGDGYQTELVLEGSYGNDLIVRGRADGFDTDKQRLEEIKTFRGTFESIQEDQQATHWAQARIYGHLLCTKLGLSELTIALVYYDVASGKEHVLEERRSAEYLLAHFQDHCSEFLHWAQQESTHRSTRDAWLRQLQLPYPDFRAGQRDLAVAVYRSARARRWLAAQASTGIGKTLGTLFPLLKAMPDGSLDKLFFLTAKTPGRSLALKALKSLASRPNPPIRVLECVAREKSCIHPDKACHGESCPLARGYYDRLPAARMEAAQAAFLDQHAVSCTAAHHNVCPYYLAQEMVRWSDVVVGDYNHYFDASAMLYAWTVSEQWQVGVLVDEAHNLLERARGMYSCTLNQYDVQTLRKQGPRALQKAFESLNRAWNNIHRHQSTRYAAHMSAPDDFIAALQRCCGAVGDYLAEYPLVADQSLLRFYFDSQFLLRLTENMDSHSIFDVTLLENGRVKRSEICLRNQLPAPFLKSRFAAAQTGTLFSATLAPWSFYGDVLGLDDNSDWVEVAPPFQSHQLQVNIATGVSTRYRDRAASIAPIVDLIAAQYRRKPGNYLVFLSSFEYLEQVRAAFLHQEPDIPVWTQVRNMDEAARQEFLDCFTESGQGVGFAVLGGAFAEGIDLPGRRLIGAFIATLGMPVVNEVNEQLRARMQTTFGRGHDYTYLYPGLRKVVQAAGRVIRSPTDEGVIYLMDERYLQPRVRALLPDWWQVRALTP